MSSEKEEFEKNKRDRARELELETLEKQERRNKMRDQKYRERLRDKFGRLNKPNRPFTTSRSALPGAEIGVEDDGVKAVEMQQLIDRYKKKDDTYTGKVIQSIKPFGKQPV
mgnify:CR=1 FL=1|tara:strand:+ start:370 stop:702 length:333 start_codon:yes stop_codon:yes gene_type:complete